MEPRCNKCERKIEYCESCNDLRETVPGIDCTGIGDKECDSLKKDTGLNPDLKVLHTNCEDLHNLRECYLGEAQAMLPSMQVCDWQEFTYDLLNYLDTILHAMMCGDCGQWEIIHCLDEKTNKSVRTVKLWEGDEKIFDLPTLEVSIPLTEFDYLDLHLLFGTEHVVGRLSLKGGLVGAPTTVVMDKVSGNATYKIDAGALIGKEVGVTFPNNSLVHINHFIWSITGSNAGTLNTVNPAVFCAFDSTESTKKYCDTQQVEDDKPHRILQIDGIISRETDSCIS